MIRKKLIFVPQNENQRVNFIELANEMIDRGFIDADNIIFVTIQKAFYDVILKYIIEFKEIKLDWQSTKPIYRMELLERLKNIMLNIRRLRNLTILKGNILIVGNDGAIQRYLNHFFNPSRLYIVCDTIIGPQSKKYILYKIVFDIASKLKLSHYFPGLSFHTKNDGIFICNQNSKNLLLDRGVLSPIYVSKMPIHNKNKRKFQERKSLKSSNKINILYVTGAYIWHRKSFEDCCQMQDVGDLASYFGRKSECHVKIRIHPREDVAGYAWVEKKFPNISISYKTPLIDDFLWCDKLLTAASSVAHESNQLGIDTYIYRKNFGNLPKSSTYKNGYHVIDCLSKVSHDLQPNGDSHMSEAKVDIAKTLFSDSVPRVLSQKIVKTRAM
jgi:hypothetical protein